MKKGTPLNNNHTNYIEQITEEDIRFYHDGRTNEYYPSVTTVLDVLPNKELDIWRDKVGATAADKIGYDAAKSGTAVHNVIEDLCQQLMFHGEASFDWLDDNGYKKLKAHEWEGVLRFVEFYDNFVEEIILTEQKLTSHTLFTGGTVDLVARVKGLGVGVIDHKFSNALSDTYPVQTWVYKEMIVENFGLDINFRANLWLKAKTRGFDKTNKKIQGKGWQLVTHDDEERDRTIWDCAHKIMMDKYRNKELVPDIKVYPRTIKLNKK